MSAMSFKDTPHTHVEKAEASSQEGDVSRAVVAHMGDWDEAEEKALIKKIDWHIMPMLCLVFGASLLDRSNISSAYVAGMAKDLELTIESRYSICLLVFFPTYALFELPSNLIIRRVGARYWLSFLIVCWGIVVLGTAFVQNWVGLAVLRVLLGVFEAGLLPGAIFIIAAWYRTFETARRTAYFYMASLLSQGFGGILAYAFSLIKVGDGMFAQGWRWIFIIEGIATILIGIASLFTLGEFPEKAKWLNSREKHIAISRVSIAGAEQEHIHLGIKGAMKALVDWKIAFYCFQYYVCGTSGYALGYFIPLILKDGLGFSSTLALILACPPYIFCIFCSIGLAWVSDKYRTRWPILCGQALGAIVGLLIILYAKPAGVRLFGTFLAVAGTQGIIPGTLAYAQNQTSRHEKRGVVSAAMISFGAAGGVTGSTIFRAQDSPIYLIGMWTTISLMLSYTIGTFCMSMYLKRQNRLVDEGKIPDALEGVPGFRYAP